MRLTVPQSISSTAVSSTSVVDWANGEAKLALSQLRNAANSEYRERQTAATLGAGTYVQVWLSPVFPTNGCQVYHASVSAISTSGAAQSAGYSLRACFTSVAGTIAQVGATAVDTFETAAGCDASFGIDATKRVVYLQVRDDATSPMNWVAVVDVNEATP